MAAMFQQQSANWEETQEKMSQLVLPSFVFLLVVVEVVPNAHRFFSLPLPLSNKMFTITERKGYIQTHEEVRLLDVEGSRLVCTMIGHCRPVTFVTGADRKVCVNYIITSCNVSTSVR